MSGLGTVQKTNGTYLSIAGGFIWNRKITDVNDPNFAKQEFVRKDKTIGTREGAQYADLTGTVIGVEFKTHDEYGESINVTVEAGGENYILSISTNNRYSQDMMKALLKADLSKPIFMKPYDFVDKTGKRANGVVFRQDGEKIVLRNDDAPSKDSDWFKTADKKKIRRFFEDLTEWFVAEIEEKVCSKLTSAPVKKQEGLGSAKTETKETEAPKTEAPKVTPLKMKKAVKAYIEENYEDKEMPKLSKDELVVWYGLVLEMEDLPFPAEETNAEVPAGDLDSQLELLIPKK